MLQERLYFVLRWLILSLWVWPFFSHFEKIGKFYSQDIGNNCQVAQPGIPFAEFDLGNRPLGQVAFLAEHLLADAQVSPKISNGLPYFFTRFLSFHAGQENKFDFSYPDTLLSKRNLTSVKSA